MHCRLYQQLSFFFIAGVIRKAISYYYTKYLKLNLYMCKYMNDVFKVMKRVYMALVIKLIFF